MRNPFQWSSRAATILLASWIVAGGTGLTLWLVAQARGLARWFAAVGASLGATSMERVVLPASAFWLLSRRAGRAARVPAATTY